MFRFFSRWLNQPKTRSRTRVPLSLEALETRDCPTAPQITMNVTLLDDQMVRLSGTVMDEMPSSVFITFSGVVSDQTVPEPGGNYSLDVQASQLGWIYAQGVDDEAFGSNIVSYQLTSAVPSITLSVSYGTQRTVTLSGSVTDEVRGGRLVAFTGRVENSVFTQADGTFSLTVEAAGLGNVLASTTDPWGQASNTAQVTLTSLAPFINYFEVTHEPQGWVFLGHVNDESPEGLIVQLGGIPSLEGQTATVDSTGWFMFTVQLIPGVDRGTATAQVTDWWGLASNVALEYVYAL